jgi:hypothetical protein
MNFLPMLVATGCAIITVVSAADSVPLPAWKGKKERMEMEARGWVAGATLLTDDSVAGESQESAAAPLVVEPPLPEEISPGPEPFAEVAEKFLPAYFAKRPEALLVDPQALLSPTDYRGRLGFLNYHASDSSIDLYVYLLGGSQEIPSAVRHEEIPERLFSEGRPAVIVYYYLGAPQRSVVSLSPSLMESVPAAEQHRALESAVMQALEQMTPAAQFEKFLVQMSIRIYWMERLSDAEPSASAGLLATSPVTVGERRAVAKAAKRAWLEEGVRRVATPVALFAFACVSLWGLRYWLVRRARYHFPEFEVEPRLGGDHAAGIGAVISFASAAVPPASQRDQVPDYLRRA